MCSTGPEAVKYLSRAVQERWADSRVEFAEPGFATLPERSGVSVQLQNAGKLDGLVAKALAEHKAGKTREL